MASAKWSERKSTLLQTRSKTILGTALFATVWIGALSFGLRALANYESAPGRVGSVPSNWPHDSKIERARTGDVFERRGLQADPIEERRRFDVG